MRFLNRLLVPLGLHHMLNSIFWFDVIGINDIGNYWAGTGIRGVTGHVSGRVLSIMMFGVVAMALAMYQCCFITRKKKMKPFFVSSAIASFLTGVTGAIRILLYVLISIALCDACFTDWYFGVYGSQLTIYCWL